MEWCNWGAACFQTSILFLHLQFNCPLTSLILSWKFCGNVARRNVGLIIYFPHLFPFTSTWDSSLQSQRLENTSMGQSKFHGCTRVSGQYLHFILGNCWKNCKLHAHMLICQYVFTMGKVSREQHWWWSPKPKTVMADGQGIWNLFYLQIPDLRKTTHKLLLELLVCWWTMRWTPWSV